MTQRLNSDMGSKRDVVSSMNSECSVGPWSAGDFSPTGTSDVIRVTQEIDTAHKLGNETGKSYTGKCHGKKALLLHVAKLFSENHLLLSAVCPPCSIPCRSFILCDIFNPVTAPTQ